MEKARLNVLSRRSYLSLVCGWRKELQRAGRLGGAESSLREIPRHPNNEEFWSEIHE